MKILEKLLLVKGDDYTTGCLLYHSYFKDHYRMIAIDLTKQQVLDSDPRATHQINFTGNFDRIRDTTMFFIIEEAKETIFEFSLGTVKILWMQLHWVVWFLSV